MSKPNNSISQELKAWIEKQKIFFVSTAPLSENGHVNCSPKGLDSLRVLNEHCVAYQDLVGSGIETIAHIQENKRLTIMFCAFDGPPKIIRLYGHGEVITPDHEQFSEMQAMFKPHAGTRAYIKLNIHRINDSCGYSVPLYEFKKDRDVLDKWVAHKGQDGIRQYIKENNQKSLDGLTGLI